MYKFIAPIFAALILVVLVGPVRAQGVLAVAPVPPDQASPFSGPDDQSKSATQQLEDAVRSELARAGLTDIRLTPMSILVRAKDADGNPVVFLLSPKSIAAGETSDGMLPDAAGTPSVPGEEKF